MNRRLLSLLAFAALSGAAGAQSPSGVEVKFENPEKFTDLRMERMTTDRERNSLLAELRAWLERDAPRRLPAGTRLAVTITDVDMAGEFEPNQRMNLANVRIVRDIYPARITLAFRLTDASGKVLKEGTRKLTSSGFPGRGARPGGPLAYEKSLLEDWLAREFA
jgi:hypothetical protein